MYAELEDMPSLSGIAPHLKDEFFRLFSLVKSDNGWKQPINKTITLNQPDIPRLIVAISMITGSRDIDVVDNGDGFYRVSAEGYYNAMNPEVFS
jgi:hypothetical protein